MSHSSTNIGQQYDEIAPWWNEYHQNSTYGMAALTRALSFTSKSGLALDVGCGSGGRLVRKMVSSGFRVTGVDASAKMIELAKRNHPAQAFIHSDVQAWKTYEPFDFILAWDSLFHLPLAAQQPVLEKLCNYLRPNGVLLHSFGLPRGEHEGEWRGQTFHYSSIGTAANLNLLRDNGLSICHLERDQYPEKHIVSIAVKTG